MAVDITGLNPGAVVAALYNAARPQGLGFLVAAADMTPEESREVLARADNWDGAARLDYVRDRSVKVRVYPDRIEYEQLYDRDNGAGSCEEVVLRLRMAGHTDVSALEKRSNRPTHCSVCGAELQEADPGSACVHCRD